MVYHQFYEELGSMQGVDVSYVMKPNNVQICNVRLNGKYIASFPIPDPSDYVDDAIIADVLNKLGMANKIALYQSM